MWEKAELDCYIYRYEGDKLLSLDGAECIYDNMGCPTVYLGKALAWNESGKLTSFAIDAASTATFAYDIMGKRISKQVGEAEAITFTYDGNGNLLSQSNGVKFLYDHAGIMGMTYGGNTYLYRKNIQGDVVALLNESGAVVARYKYDAWGNHKIYSAEGIDISNNSQYNEHVGNINPIRYRGYYFDAETGLYYLPARYYDPVACRFISRDDYSYLDPETVNGLNLFAYCGNNPVMCYDPSGHDLKSFFKNVKDFFVDTVWNGFVVPSWNSAVNFVTDTVPNFVVNNVWNKGIVPAWKWVTEFATETIPNFFVNTVWNDWIVDKTWNQFLKGTIWQKGLKPAGNWVWDQLKNLSTNPVVNGILAIGGLGLTIAGAFISSPVIIGAGIVVGIASVVLWFRSLSE